MVPLLFAHLPSPALAGGMAARLFGAQTWVSLGCGLGLLLLARAQPAAPAGAPEPLVRLLTLGAMLLALLLEFAVAPRILAREHLALWHGLGSAMYVLQCLCALWLFARIGARARAAQS